MPAPEDLDRRIMEAFVAGRQTAADLGPLAQFADDLRVVVGGPVPAPSPQLAQMLAEGMSTDDRKVPATAGAAGSAGLTRPERRSWRKPKMAISELLAGLAAKLSALGVAAKIALGAGVAAASVTTAGVAGVLPPAAQHAVATVVNVSPLQIPDGTDATDGRDATKAVVGTDDTTPPTTGDATGTVGTGDDSGTDDSAGAADTHGACVSEVAKSAPTGAGGVHGKAVSEAAKTCPKGTEAGEGDDEVTTTTSTTVASGDTGGDTATATAGTGQDHGQSGESHGQSGQTHGNSGHTAAG